jgi:hypothetical protein
VSQADRQSLASSIVATAGSPQLSAPDLQRDRIYAARVQEGCVVVDEQNPDRLGFHRV